MPTTGSLQSYDIERAQHALQQVDKLGSKPDKELVATAKKLPMMIRTCGLAQALAFYDAKHGNHEKISLACADWLRTRKILTNHPQSSLSAQLVNDHSSPERLRRCTSEVMAYLYWYIRFLDARKG